MRGAEECYVAIAPDLKADARLARTKGRVALGPYFAVRLSVAYNGVWIRRTESFARTGADDTLADVRRWADALAVSLRLAAPLGLQIANAGLPAALRVAGWTLEAPVGTRPLERVAAQGAETQRRAALWRARPEARLGSRAAAPGAHRRHRRRREPQKERRMSISALAECVATIRAESEHHRTAIGLHTADTLAVLGAGLKAREGERIARFFGGGDEAMRAAGMAAVIRFTECDDIHVPSCMTAGAIVIPVRSTFAVDSQSYARAVEAGYAVGLAFAQSVGGVRALAQGVWPALFAAPAVAAVTASVAMKCDRAVTASALGLAMAGASGRAGRPGGWPSGRWLLFGEATLKGIRAALAALQGFRGDIDLISEPGCASRPRRNSPTSST